MIIFSLLSFGTRKYILKALSLSKYLFSIISGQFIGYLSLVCVCVCVRVRARICSQKLNIFKVNYAVYSVYLILCLLVILNQSFVSRFWWMEHNMLIHFYRTFLYVHNYEPEDSA
jgi:hypothetical protein